MPTLIEKPAVVRCFAARAHYARHERGLRIRDVAERGGLDRGELSRLERGHHEVKFPTLHAIARGLDAPVGWLAELDEPDEFEPVPSGGPAADNPEEDFAQRLREARRERGMTHGELAERAGTWKRTVIGYEQQEKAPHLAAAHRLAAALGVPIGWLLAGEGSI